MRSDQTDSPTEAVTADESLEAPLPAAEVDDPDATQPAATWIRVVAAVGACLILIAGSTAFFLVDVCEEQLSSKGDAVKVCRHVQASDPPAVALGVALVAMLSVFFTEISGFGFTMKRNFARLTRANKATNAQVERNKEAIRETSQHAADVGTEIVALRSVSSEAAPPPRPADDPIRALADEYNRIRLTMPSGRERTTAMTNVVTKLISAVGEATGFDVPAHLNSDDRGLRLAAYAYLYARPEPRSATALASTIIDVEDKPFGQYWGLRALTALCGSDASALDANNRRRLEQELRPTLPVGSDRYNELTATLNRCAAG